MSTDLNPQCRTTVVSGPETFSFATSAKRTSRSHARTLKQSSQMLISGSRKGTSQIKTNRSALKLNSRIQDPLPFLSSRSPEENTKNIRRLTGAVFLNIFFGLGL